MPEQVSIEIAGQRWGAWNSIEIRRTLDSFSSVSFGTPFEPERRAFRETFKPFSFKDLDVYIEESRLFAGTLVGMDPVIDPDSRTLACTGYSRPAVLQDVTPPASAWPLELNGLRLRAIAETLLEPFGLSVQMDADEGASFRRVAIKPDEGIYGFLVGLAQQRGLVISDTPFGALRFLRSAPAGEPVARFREGEAPLQNVTPTFSPQSYFSEITGLAKTRAGRGGSKYTVKNPWLDRPLRPLSFQLDDTDGADVPAAAKAKLGRMFANVLTLQIDVPTWRDPRSRLWEPNTTVMLEAPGAMIWRETEFLIREVTLRQDAELEDASLLLVLPGAFSGEAPTELPWD